VKFWDDEVLLTRGGTPRQGSGSAAPVEQNLADPGFVGFAQANFVVQLHVDEPFVFFSTASTLTLHPDPPDPPDLPPTLTERPNLRFLDHGFTFQPPLFRGVWQGKSVI
jgi:hypothetical protein